MNPTDTQDFPLHETYVARARRLGLPNPYETQRDSEISVDTWQEKDGSWATQMVVKFPNGQVLTATGKFAITLEQK